MKKVILTAAIILGGLSTYATSFEINHSDEISVAVSEEYVEIKASELPKAVKDALASDFARATVNRAYVNAKQEYKLEISIQEVTSAVHADRIYADKDGNWIDKENRERMLIPVGNATQEITKQTKQ